MTSNETDLKSFLDHLTNVSKENSAETFFMSGMSAEMFMLLYIMLMKKYKYDCVLNINRDQKGAPSTVLADVTKTEILAKQIVSCVKSGIRVIVIPMRILGINGSNPHANMLIYKVFEKYHQIDHFEPHGVRPMFSHNPEEINSIIRSLIENIKAQYRGKLRLKYRRPADVCPINVRRGIQLTHEDWLRSTQENTGAMDARNNVGLCAYWAFLVAELVLKFPEMKTKDIVRTVYESSSYNDLIRGFVFYHNDELNALYMRFRGNPEKPRELYKNLRNYINKKYLKTSLLNYFGTRMTRRGGKKRSQRSTTLRIYR